MPETELLVRFKNIEAIKNFINKLVSNQFHFCKIVCVGWMNECLDVWNQIIQSYNLSRRIPNYREKPDHTIFHDSFISSPRVRFFSFTLIIYFTNIFSAQAQVYPDTTVDSLLRTGIHYVVQQDYSSANKIFTKLNKEYPSLPLGKIYLAANKIAEAYDYAEDFDESYIRENLETAKAQTEKLHDPDNRNIWYRYFYALSEGYIAYFEAINGSWFSALTTGVNSISEFEDILTSDKNFFEAYIAIGTFEYWKSRKLELIDWIPFSHDTKKQGIEFLKVAIDSSSYNSHLAINSLIWIYIDQNRFNDAIDLAQNALKEFPESRTFKWGMARAYEEINPQKAIELYKQILASYPDIKNGNYINEITLKHIIAQQYVKLGDRESAIRYCDEILSMKNIPQKILEQMDDRLQRVKELKKVLTSKS